jgi:hypothetical protein
LLAQNLAHEIGHLLGLADEHHVSRSLRKV